MELDELLREARIRYPVGTKYMTMCNTPIIKAIESEVEWSDTESFIIDKNDYIIYIASSNEWAEIISVPDINYSYLTKLLKKLGVK
jgi:hypothetical protein